MVKDHSEIERKNLLLQLHEQLFLINSKGSFICIIPQTGYTIVFCYTSHGALAGMSNISMGPP